MRLIFKKKLFIVFIIVVLLTPTLFNALLRSGFVTIETDKRIGN